MVDKDFRTLRLWLVHDWLTGFRGGEKILLQLVRMFPRARIATLIHLPGTTHPELDARVARTSFLQQLPGAARNFRNYLPLFPRAIRSIQLDGDCDLVLSISHAVAKGIRPPPGIAHICYCNTPMRYIWGMEDQYLPPRSLKRLALRMATPALRRFDRETGNVTLFIANSQNVAQRIRRFYGRDSLVVYAGIDHEVFVPPSPETPRENFYLCAGALVPYKRIDVAVRAFCESAGFAERRLVIIGSGPEEKRLRHLAANAINITFLGRQPDNVLRDHYQRCRAFLFPGEEDFGLTPLEAQACAAPVIGYRAGGLLETVSELPPNPTGLFFDEQSPAALRAAVARFESLPTSTYSRAALSQNAQRFTWDRFSEGILSAISSVIPSSINKDASG